jgi:hypothetical protein
MASFVCLDEDGFLENLVVEEEIERERERMRERRAVLYLKKSLGPTLSLQEQRRQGQTGLSWRMCLVDDLSDRLCGGRIAPFAPQRTFSVRTMHVIIPERNR